MLKSLYVIAATLAVILLSIVNQQVKQTTIIENNKKSNIQAVIYSKADCLYCTSAKELLSNENINYTDTDISDNDELRQKLIEETKQFTVPYIFINGKFIGGYQQLANLKSTRDFNTYFQSEEFLEQ